VKRFQNKVVMVTGAAGNLGYAVAKEFMEAGAKLVLTDHKPDRLHGLFPAFGQEDHFLASPINSLNVEEISGAARLAMEKFGRIDVLVNTVGGYAAGDAVHQTDYEQFDFMINLNLKTAVLACQAVIPIMVEKKGGKIINIGSRAGLKGSANSAAYSASKAAVIRLTESISAEVRAEGINVNCVLPGIIDTPQNREAMPKANFSHWVTPQSIARVILFLASDDAKDIHGVSVPVYGLT